MIKNMNPLNVQCSILVQSPDDNGSKTPATFFSVFNYTCQKSCHERREMLLIASADLLLGERTAQTTPRALDTVANSLTANDRAAIGALRGAASHGLVGKVASAATANVVDGSLVLHHASLALEFLVEAEDGTLAGVVHVAGAAPARGVVGCCMRAVESGARGGACGIFARGYDFGVDV